MKAWEMIKELTENPGKKFKYDTGRQNGIVAMIGGAILLIEVDGRTENKALKLHSGFMAQDWEEVKKPVSWQEAFKAALEGKRIKPVGQHLTFPYYGSLLYVFKYLLERQGCFEKVMLDDWYIE